MDALADWEHGSGHAAAAGKWWCVFTLILTCRPHPGQYSRHLSGGVTGRRDCHLSNAKDIHHEYSCND
tara:strand:+ start:4992 stop:5195 length:204 start_codon:yes stop_codon:yes gene_type:complete